MERFDYGWFKTRDRAELAIENYFAAGEIDNSDRPQIETRRTPRGMYYAVTLLGMDRHNAKF
jgi:hypothetical protein